MNNSLSSDEMIVENINKSLNQLRIYTEQFDLLEEYLSLKNQLKELSKENKLLKKSNAIMTDTSANYFCDGNESDKENNSDEIIHFDKRLF